MESGAGGGDDGADDGSRHSAAASDASQRRSNPERFFDCVFPPLSRAFGGKRAKPDFIRGELFFCLFSKTVRYL